MKRTILFAAMAAATASTLPAQGYNTAVGLRLNGMNGISVQQRLWGKITLEGMLTTNFAGRTRITVLGEVHKKILHRNLNFYTGAGLHKEWQPDVLSAETGKTLPEPFGISGIVGLELTLGRLNLSVDYKPAVNITGTPVLQFAQFGFSARYVLIKRSKDNRKKLFKNS